MDINKTLIHISELNAEVSSLKHGIQEEIANAIGVASFQVRIQTHQVIIEMNPERKYRQRVAAKEYAVANPKHLG